MTISKSCQQLLTCFVKEDDSKIFSFGIKICNCEKRAVKKCYVEENSRMTADARWFYNVNRVQLFAGTLNYLYKIRKS